MRTKPLVGREAWFGPRRWGRGLAPVTAEGWAVVVVAAGALFAAAVALHHDRWLCLIAAVVLIAVVFLKGTSPGGSDQWAEYQAIRDRDRPPGSP